MGAEGPIEKPPPVRTWRPMILWSGGILLALGLAWFVGAVAVPCWQVRSFVKNAPYKGATWEQLGGERRACQRLSRYIRWPEWLAPRKLSAMTLLSCCDGGPEALTAILLDEQAPLDVRLPVAEYLGQEWDNRADLPGDIWREQALLRALNSSSGRVRVAAARSFLRSHCFRLTDPEADAVLAQLLGDLKGADVLVRREAARALHAFAADIERGPMIVANARFARVVEPALKAALEDPDPTVRAEAAEALKHKMVKKTVRWVGPGE